MWLSMQYTFKQLLVMLQHEITTQCVKLLCLFYNYENFMTFFLVPSVMDIKLYIEPLYDTSLPLFTAVSLAALINK